VLYLVTAQGHRLEYQEWLPSSPSARVPLVLLHEGLGAAAMWRTFPDALAARTGRRVVAYSRLGHGGSAPRPRAHDVRFMHQEARDVLPDVLDRLGLDRVVLLGHSDGGSIALLFAAAYPARVSALVLEAPHVFVEPVAIASITGIKHRFETSDLPVRLAKYHGANTEGAFRGWNDIWLHPDFAAWNIEDALPDVTCPTLVLQGDEDEYGTVKQVEAIARQSGGRVETRWLPACGHRPHRDQPDAVLEAIAAFLGPED
jgi:pimeloyl-ACP methyl ester carboxylesterase